MERGKKKHDERALERERTLLAAFGVVNALAAGLTGATVGREQGASGNQVVRCLTDPIWEQNIQPGQSDSEVWITRPMKKRFDRPIAGKTALGVRVSAAVDTIATAGGIQRRHIEIN